MLEPKYSYIYSVDSANGLMKVDIDGKYGLVAPEAPLAYIRISIAFQG